MPNSRAFWLLASPLDASTSEDMASDLAQKLGDAGKETSIGGMNVPKPTGSRLGQVGKIALPELKTGTLSSLVAVSDACAKQDPAFTSVLGKIVETIRSLDPESAERHLVIDDGRPYDDYLLGGWSWNRAKYRTDNKSLQELVDSFVKDMTALDNSHKAKLGAYNGTKGQLQTLQRKKQGNLATRDLATVLDRESAAPSLKDSEYFENVYVAVPNVKDWTSKYERLTNMVVPRSAIKVAADDEFTLFSVTIFRKVKDEFAQKCREEKFTVREFTFDEAATIKQQHEIEELERQEKDLWSELIRLSRINFSEGVQLLVHLKVIRAYVESVLRYGLPAQYFTAFVKPDAKQAKKLISTLNEHFEPFTPAPASASRDRKSKGGDDAIGEYQNVLEQELFNYVLFEVPSLEGLSER